jgi:ABC-2 type transport system permease protein
MPEKYNQLRAMLAITKASLVATFRSPQSIFFSLFFPIVLIWIFGSLSGNRGAASVEVAFEKNADSNNILYHYLKANPLLKFTDKKNIEDDLKKGRIIAVINILPGDSGRYNIHLRTSSASEQNYGLLYSIIQNVKNQATEQAYANRPAIATITHTQIKGRQYKMIDFFLPGMIGFSLIGSAIFGVAFSFFFLRENLVLKRLYATPIKRAYIIIGESFSKVIFQLTTVVVLILFGYYIYDFTLAHGLITFLNMLTLSALGLLVFMGFGFFISSVSKNQNVIPIYSNLFMFPQYFLSGTFFSKAALPASIQPIIKFLPLTALNDAMRNVAFEGANLTSCWEQILILLAWGIVIYFITVKVFRWE